MKYWSRDDTKSWIAMLECRAEDFVYHKNEAQKWCQENNITDSDTITLCVITSCVWVAHMRQEEISFGEICDILGAQDVTNVTMSEMLMDFNDVISFRPGIADIELNELLVEVVNDKYSS